ncbi:helix-turn-helix domain-containing protein [Cellulomonas xiejunii]|uniref:helix-turn-helix domain-containing protein n=1 Tax=Cellulomonas xiejunii TaxID=2968083 RepID=UPI001D0F180E|nr:helix-turn-helix transcriptional regulator [Cellulomonas xiejunii]MCC2313771.1 helix-turn-helix domain-containing protein [Cellulomonas xiejunii]
MAQTPIAVARAMAEVGESLRTWRRLRELTVAETADRAGVGVSTLQRLERGQGGTVETLLRVVRALGVLDQLTGALDPLSTDVGRLRAAEALPTRVRRRGVR